MRDLIPSSIAALAVGFALCDAWGFALTTIIAAVVALGVSRAVSPKRY